MDSKLDELIAKKKELEREISILKKNSQICGCAKLDKDHYSTSKPDEWYVAIFQESCDEWDKKRGVRGRWRSVIRDRDKKVVIDKIDDVIADLQGLKNKLTEGTENE